MRATLSKRVLLFHAVHSTLGGVRSSSRNNCFLRSFLCGRARVQIAERLRQRIAAIRMSAGDRDVRLTASFGVCGRDRVTSEELHELLRHADGALYRAKHLGRNRSVFCDIRSGHPIGDEDRIRG